MPTTNTSKILNKVTSDDCFQKKLPFQNTSIFSVLSSFNFPDQTPGTAVADTSK